MQNEVSHCCLCGLMCPDLQPAAGSRLLVSAEICPRRQHWLAQQQLVSAHKQPDGLPASALGRLLEKASHPLVWVEGADVNTMRSLVTLAESRPMTLHVAHSTGAGLSKRVLISEGWLGSSLSEVACHADLIITLGDGLLAEAPLFAERVVQPAKRAQQAVWCQLSTGSRHEKDSAAVTVTPDLNVVWPRNAWYQQLSSLLLHLRNEPAAPALDEAGKQLLLRLRAARYAVWVWDADEFCEATDELTIRRLLSIARCLSDTRRCSLLCLDSQVGRVTADETLLWLTGWSTNAVRSASAWLSPPHLSEYTLEDWRREFETIIVVRTVPSLHPLPNLAAEHYLLAGSASELDSAARHAGVAERTTWVEPFGHVGGGHLTRGDRNSTLLCQAVGTAEKPLPSVEAILHSLQPPHFVRDEIDAD